MSVTLEFQGPDALPLDLAGVTPAALAGRSVRDIEHLPIVIGNRQAPLAEAFRVRRTTDDGPLVVTGRLEHVRNLGAAMTSGELRVEGSPGAGCGRRMAGGALRVAGNVGDDAGQALRGGLLHVQGNAGDRLAAASPGAWRGMTGGEVLVEGRAGHDCGTRMRRGLIAVRGGAGCGLGARMLAGTIYVGGPCGPDPGAGMHRGTLGLWGPEPPRLPSTFRYCGAVDLPMLPLLAARLAAWGMRWQPPPTGPVALYLGDFLGLGRGEIMVRAPA
jgi:formylmethanofuran dehydrogenase subunit C